MSNEVIEASQLPHDDKVYLKKSFGEWRVVNPIRDENGKLNWFNLIFGGRSGLLLLIYCLVLAALFFLGINELLAGCRELAANPCLYCEGSAVNKIGIP